VVRQLLPDLIDEIDPIEATAADPRPAPADRPWLLVNMVASLDGATAVQGRSGGLAGPADKAMFHALRQIPDVILVGAATARAENYGPVALGDEARARRSARGQDELPRLAIVTGRVDLDPASRLFSDPAQRPIVITTEDAPPDAVARVRPVADLLVAGHGRVDLGMAMAQLHAEGARTVLCEGGPTLNGDLLAADLIDEWCQTITPILAAGDSMRGAHGPPPGLARALPLRRVIEDEGFLLLRYARDS
jgi:riboflavin-specific deaminase-like protein